MSLSVKATKNFFKTCAAAVTLGVALAPSNALAVTTWNWSFATDIADQFGSGTFTTADVFPTPGTTYQITGVSGTYNRGGTAYTITGLDTNDSFANQFRWSGTSSSSILSDFFEYIVFKVTSGSTVGLCNTNPGFNPINRSFPPFRAWMDLSRHLLSPPTAHRPPQYLARFPCSEPPLPSRPAAACAVD
jgi:hypothetical protein